MTPIIAIQMSALKSGEKIGLVFTTVVNQLSLGMVDEDEEIAEVTDRGFWVDKTSKKTLAMVDELCDMVKTFDPELELKYNKFYIGLAKNGSPNNFVVFNPKKNFIRIEPRIIKSEETQERLETAGLDVMDYDVRWGRYRIRLNPNDMVEHKELLVALIGEAYEAANS